MVMYKIDRRGGTGGVQKSYTRTDPMKGERFRKSFSRKLIPNINLDST